MPPALKALLAQLGGWFVAWLLARFGLLSAGIWPLVFAQAVAAVVVAAGLRSARWWLPIHLVFTPLAVATLALGIPSWAWLAAFVALALVYWSSFRTQVPLFLTNRKTADAVAELLPTGAAVLDIGCGVGSLLVALAQKRADLRLTGIENAPAPCALAWLRTRKLANVTVARGDFFARSWAEFDVVYAFLSPVPMAEVWEKARREMKPGSVLVSNSFAIPGVEPQRVVEVDDRRRTRLLVFAL
ncbi:MAG: class I SAM-dependent methyltransferase [Azoarcus sp.]|jgi:SAM-dependent methyltransferase|nr:class I SAM-dependent methyltransferase [Azoarcus sp.]